MFQTASPGSAATPAAASPGAAAAAPSGASAAAAAANVSQLIYSTQVRLFIFNRASNQYEAAGGGGACGCVIVGGGAKYALLIYDAAKKYLCQAPMRPDFKLTVQPNFYVSFSVDDKAFSVNLSSDVQLHQFCKHVMATTAHASRFSGKAMAASVLQVSTHSNDDGSTPTVEPGDTCGVAYTCLDISKEANDDLKSNLAAAPSLKSSGEMTKIKALPCYQP